MSADFCHVHTHSHSSAFDGLGKETEFVEKAARLGNEAIAFTEHGSLRGLYEAHTACEDHGLKLIPGCEFYLADDASRQGLSDDEKKAIKDRHEGDKEAAKAALKSAGKRRRERDHVTVWALDDVGLRNLYRLSAWSWGAGFYYKPRIDMAQLTKHAEGLAVSTGCAGGVVADPLRHGNYPEAFARAATLAEAFGDRFYVEVMPHVIAGAEGLQSMLLRTADRYGGTVIATQDAHYPDCDDAHAQETLLCIQTGDRMANPDRFRFDSRNYWLRTRAEMMDAFARCPGVPLKTSRQALDATLAFADRCTARIRTEKPGRYLVAPELPPSVGSYDEWLLTLCRRGFPRRFGGSPVRRVTERLLHELRTIRDLGFASYFVAVWDVVEWARGEGIFVGPGRGSAAGSLVSYLLGITNVDPLHHGLMFERFLAPGRLDLPDIDLDFESRRRDDVLDYLRLRYGEDRVAHISTHNTLGGRRTLRDLARIYGIKDRDIAPVIGLVPSTSEEGDEESLAAVLRNTEVGRRFAVDHPEIAEVCERLEGQLRDVGLHAAGVVVSSVPLVEVIPVESRARRGGPRVPSVAFDMIGAEAMGLVKLDVLGLRTLDVVARATDLAGIEADEIDIEDPDTLAGFTDLRFGGVFQFDSPSARRLCKGFEFRRFDDVAVITALNRPGPMKSGLADEFKKAHADPTRKVRAVHPAFDEVMAATFGVPVYQEQVIALVRALCGYSAEDADGFRKAVAKKKPADLAKHEPMFLDGAQAAGMHETDAEALWDKLLGFAGYAFNKCVDTATLVATPSGARRIDALREGDKVYEVGSDGVEVGRVEKVWPVEERDAVEIAFDDGSRVVCSPEHRWLTERGVATAAQIIAEGWAVASAGRLAGEVREDAPVPQAVSPALQGVQDLSGDQAGDPLRDDATGQRGEPGGVPTQPERDGDQDLGPVGGHGGESRAAAELAAGEPRSGAGDSGARPDLYRPRREAADADRAGADPPSARLPAQRAGEGGSDAEAGRFRRAVPRRGRRALPLPPAGGGGEVSTGEGEGSGALRVGHDGWQAVGSSGGGLLRPRRAAGGLGSEGEGGAPRSPCGRHTCRRPLLWRRLAPRPMADVGVSNPRHLFVLDNGLISHNSHAVCYGVLAVWCMHLKVHHPAAFYAAALAAEPDEQTQVRLAAEARHAGIPVLPPTVNAKAMGFALVENGAGFAVVGAIDDVKGIGPTAATAIRNAAPFTSLLDLYQRTAGKGHRVTAKTFEALAQTTALRDLYPNARFLAANAKPIWKALRAGWEPGTAPGPDHEGDALVESVSAVWPLYATLEGRSRFDAVLDRVRAKATRELLTPGDVDADREGAAVLFGRVGAVKLFSTDDGRQSARLSLISGDGEELLVRADPDVVGRSSVAISKAGNLVVAVVTLSGRGGARLERAWLADAVLVDDLEGRSLPWLLRPERTRPRDPQAALARSGTDSRFGVEGVVIRRREHKDKRGGRMLTVGILGERGFVRFLVFSSRMGKDVKHLTPGARVVVRLTKLSGSGAALADSRVEVVNAPPSGA